MSIENPTLAHFRHFSSLLTNLLSLCLCFSAPLNLCTNRPRPSVFSHLSPIITYFQKHLILTNKPNFGIDKMSITIDMTSKYEILSRWKGHKNKPNSNPIKPKTKPIKAKTNPIQTQSGFYRISGP